jgi:4-hydroxy-tetrahydrodipicolinate synthase
VLERLVNHLIKSGIHGLTLFGSTGEFPYLNQQQKEEILKTVLKVNQNRIPIITGVSHFSTEEAVYQARRFESLGTDGILAAINIYFPLNPKGIYEYFSTIARNVKCPVIIYHNPKFANADFSLDLIEKMAKVPNIKYIKYASPNPGKVISIISRCKGKLKVFSATANIPLLVLMMGGVGWMAGPACVIPRQSVQLFELVKQKKWEEAIELQKKLWEINSLFQKFGLAACIKAGLEIQGFPVGDPIPPQKTLTISEKEEIAHALKQISW